MNEYICIYIYIYTYIYVHARHLGLGLQGFRVRFWGTEEVSASGLCWGRKRRELMVSYQGDQIYIFDATTGPKPSTSRQSRRLADT